MRTPGTAGRHGRDPLPRNRRRHPGRAFAGGDLRAVADAGLLVRDGVLVERGPFAEVRARHRAEDVVVLADGILLPGLVDTHVHCPQVRAIGGLGVPLLEWLERYALPEEARSADTAYATSVAAEFLGGLVQSGTTTALVLGAHYPGAVDVLFEQAARVGLRITGGLVVSDRLLREDLLTTPQRAYDEALTLARRWHGNGRSRYAVVPRFSLSCTGDLLDACAALLRAVPGSWFTSHINENVREIETVTGLFGVGTYLDTYDAHGLVGPRQRAGAQRAPVGRGAGRPGDEGRKRGALPDQQLCPRQRALPAAAPRRRGSARRPRLRRRCRHRSLPVQGRAAGLLRPADARRAGAPTRTPSPPPPRHGRGRTRPGPRRRRRRPQRRQAVRRGVGASARAAPSRSPCAMPGGPEEALAKVFALATPADVARVWVDGQVVHPTAASDPDGRSGGLVRSRRRHLAWPQDAPALTVTGGDGRAVDA